MKARFARFVLEHPGRLGMNLGAFLRAVAEFNERTRGGKTV